MADVKTETPLDKLIARLLLKHALKSIEITVTERRVTAKALPQPYHKLVAERRQEELESAATAAGGSLSIAEATRINEVAVAAPLAIGHGATIDDAMFDLHRALKAL